MENDELEESSEELEELSAEQLVDEANRLFERLLKEKREEALETKKPYSQWLNKLKRYTELVNNNKILNKSQINNVKKIIANLKLLLPEKPTTHIAVEMTIAKNISSSAQINIDQTNMTAFNNPQIPEHTKIDVHEHTHLPSKIQIPLEPSWHLPNKPSCFIGRTEILVQLEQYLEKKLHEEKNKSSRQPIVISAVHGMGGVGKTQVALEYAHQHKKSYDHIFWFSAKDTDALKKDYRELAERLYLREPDSKESFETTWQKLKGWFEREESGTCLLIYDDAENETTVKPYYPQDKHQILITSRYNKWSNNVQFIPLGLFTIQECRQYVQVILGKECAAEEIIDQLSETLGRLPLALAQACGYLKNNPLIEISVYLERYQNDKKKYLLERPEITLEQGQLPVLLTYNITRERIKNKSPLANELLNVSAFLNHQNIVYSIFETYAKLKIKENHGTLLDEALSLLSNYSLIQLDKEKTTSLHVLLQEVIKLQLTLEEKKDYKEFIADSLIKLHSPKNEKNEVEDPLKNIELKRLLSPHFVAVVDSKNLSLRNFSQKDIEDLKSLPRASWEKLSEQYEALYNKIQQINEKNFTQQIVLFSNEELEYIQCALEQNHRTDLSIKIQELSEQQDMHALHMAIMLDQAAKNAMDLGDPKKALSLWMRALIIRKKHFGLNHPMTVDIIEQLGDAYSGLKQPWQAKEAYEFVLQAKQRYCSSDQIEEIASLYNKLGIIFWYLQMMPEAKLYYKKALKIFQKHYGRYGYSSAVIIGNLGLLYKISGKLLAAKGLLKKALAIYIKYYSARYPKIVSKIESLLDTYSNRYSNKHLDEHLLQEALTVYTKHSGAKHDEIAKVIRNLGLVYIDLGDMKQAKPLIEQALEIKIAIYGHNHPIVSETKVDLGIIYLKLWDLNSSEKLCQESYKAIERYYGSNSYILVTVLEILHHIFLMKNDFTHSYLYISRAYTIICTHFDVNHVRAREMRVFLDKAKQNYIKASSSGFILSHFSFDEFIKLVNISETDWKKARCYDEKLSYKIQQSKNSKTAYKNIRFSNEETKLIKKILENKNLKDLSMKLIFNLADFSEQELGTHFLEQAEMRNKLAIKHYQSESYQDAVNFFKEALDFLSLLTDKNQKILFEQAILQHNLGGAYLKLQENELASYYLHQSLALVKKLKKEEDDLFKKIQNKIKIVNKNLLMLIIYLLITNN